MRHTAISWTTHTWNPTYGCSKVSSGCDFCYAESIALKFGQSTKPWTGEHAAENVRLKPKKLNDPRALKEPARVFVNSMSDLFHALVPDDYVRQVFDVMAACPQHVFQVLTKRPERMRRWCEVYQPAPLPNVWLGTSVENQTAADRRIDQLLATPAAVRFLSCEPLLGPVDLGRWLQLGRDGDGRIVGGRRPYAAADAWRPDLDWVIVGGESGLHLAAEEHAGRRMDHAWARALRDQCAASGVAFFFKQDSGLRTEQRPYLVEADGRHTVIQEFPDAPRVTPAPAQPALL